MATKPAPSALVLNVEEALDLIDKSMERVKALYEQYFLGIQKQPPTFIHNDLERKLRDLQQVQIRNTALRYRYATLQQKFGSYNSYWRRTLRQIEQGTYGRSLAKLGRKAAETGAEIPEEILAKMPKRMREAVRRDREAALALAARRGKLAPTAAENPDDGGDFYEEFAPATPVSRVDARGAHVLDATDGDFDLDSFFAEVSAEEESEATTSGPPPKPEPATSSIPTAPSAPAVQRASVLGGMPRAQSPTMRAQTNPGVGPAPRAMDESESEPVVGGAPLGRPRAPMPTSPSQTGQQPARPSGQMPAQTEASGQMPAQTGASQAGQQPARPSGQIPHAGASPARPSGQLPSQPGQPPARPSGQMPAQAASQSGQQPARPSGQIPSPSQPGQQPVRPSGQIPSGQIPQAGASPSQPGQQPARPSGQKTGASPSQSGQQPARPSGQMPSQPGQSPARPSGQMPAQAGASPSQPGQQPPRQMPVVQPPSRATGPVPALRPSTTQPGQPLRAPTSPTGLPTIPAPGQLPALPKMPSPFAPSQGVRPNPIAPGSSATKQVGVETMQGPFAREPSVAVPARRSKRDTDLDSLLEATPTSPAVPTPGPMRPTATPQAMRPTPTPPMRPTPTPQAMRPAPTPQRPAAPVAGNAPKPPGRPPPGMSDADVDALYNKYVKAKEMVGEPTNAQTYGKLLNTINAQAPKIMEQYKASGVDFSVVVKDNQVIIKAKPKP